MHLTGKVNAEFVLKNVRCRNIIRVQELSIAAGETTCVLGESGSGKTTLLKLLNHMIDYEQGTITYRGQELKNLNAVSLRREVILLPQVPVIFPGTIKDNLLIGLIFAGKEPADDSRLLAELQKVGLQKELDSDADPLSGGEKQRLALARAMLMEPKVLLLDEPTSALDEEIEHKIITYINDYLACGGNTLILVTHATRLATEMADKIVTIKNGIVTAAGEVA